MEISKNSFWLKMYRFFLGQDDPRNDYFDPLPKSLCPLFWGGLFGLFCALLSPFSILYFSLIDRDEYFLNKNEGIIGVVHVFITMAIIFCLHLGFLVGLFFELSNMGLILSSILFVPILSVILVFLIWLILEIPSFTAKTSYNLKSSVPVQGVISIYNRICPLITYKDEE